MRRRIGDVALTSVCLVLTACGASHHSPARSPADLTGATPHQRPVVAITAVRHEFKITQRYGSAAAPTVGEVLTTTTGTWPNSPTKYAYHWQRCDSSGASCTNISGQTSSAYTITSVDVGDTLRSTVTASNIAGSATDYAAVSGVVSASVATPVAQFHITNDTDTTTVSEAAQYQIVQMQYSPTVKTLVDEIHADDPGVVVLMYSDPTVQGSGESGTDGWTTCTASTQDAGQNAWYLYDGSTQIGGKMNLGNISYQNACVSTAERLAKSADFDGVFWDEIDADPSAAISQPCINAYRASACSLYNDGSVSSWDDNSYSFIQAVGSYDSSHGMKSVINASTDQQTSVWERWNGPVWGAMEESFVGSYLGKSVSYAQWQSELADEVWSEAHHKYMMCMHYDPNQNQESLDTYGLASMLLAANGYSSYSSTVPSLNDATYDWWPEYTQAQNLGAPQGAYTTVPSGGATVYERRFANGIVVVNPTRSSAEAVSLGGRYSGTGNEPSSVTALTLPAQTGYVLTAERG
jgi:hypothetical protein